MTHSVPTRRASVLLRASECARGWVATDRGETAPPKRRSWPIRRASRCFASEVTVWMPSSIIRRTSASTSGRNGSTKSSARSEEHTSELQSLMRISYAVFCLKKKKQTQCITNKTLKQDRQTTVQDKKVYQRHTTHEHIK